MNNKGQAVLSEYVMIIFIVIAMAVAIAVYLQRALEARIHETRNFMIKSVVDSGACDANCMNAAGGNIAVEYEPYYTQMLSDVDRHDIDNSGATNGSAAAMGVIDMRSVNETAQTVATSTQLPPQCAAGGC